MKFILIAAYILLPYVAMYILIKELTKKFKFMRGEKGDMGPTGPTGMKGDPGKCVCKK